MGFGVDLDNGTPVAWKGDANGVGRVLLYDANNQPVIRADRAAVTPGVTSGLLNAGVDGKIARLARVSSAGTLRTSDDALLLEDMVEGAAVNTSKWIQTLTTMTVTQSNGVITLNAGSSVATTVGALHTSHSQFPFRMRSGLVFRSRMRYSAHFANNLIELGFGEPTSATLAGGGNGAFWQKDSAGGWTPQIYVNNASVANGATISDATFRGLVATTDWAIFEVILFDHYAVFSIRTSAGVLVAEETVQIPATVGSFFVTHVRAFHRIYNQGVVATAVQMFVAGTTIYAIDSQSQPDWRSLMSGQGQNALTSPTAFTQLANYANSAAPASATLSNTAAGYTTLGGQWQFAAVAGAETDYALFGVQIPAPFAFHMTGIRVTAFVMGAAVATTPTLLQWSLALNSSAVSLATAAPYSPMRQTLGVQSFPVGAAIGAAATDISEDYNTPLVVQPGRFIHLILKMPVATATASSIIRGTARFGGWFE